MLAPCSSALPAHAQAVETFEAASAGNRAGRFFLRTYCVHPRHLQGTSPLRAGNPLFFLKEFPHGPFPHQIHDAFAGRRPCAPQRAIVQVPRVR
ncbi:hypothetical protein XAC3607_1530004 [Xanthomonas citri pv. citri]|nr:hypothetical protein XAC3615_14210003 [Xanthomonas citri pv. citri]CEH75131.1 hypothetical protein XAC3607_1530004 [Xanthomonas citri pv. citri]